LDKHLAEQLFTRLITDDNGSVELKSPFKWLWLFSSPCCNDKYYDEK